MATPQQNRRIGMACLVASAVILTCSIWFEREGRSFKTETAWMHATPTRGYQWAYPSSFFVLCKDLASRCFSLGVVAGCAGLFFLHRERLQQRIEVLEKEIHAMRTLMPR